MSSTVLRQAARAVSFSCPAQPRIELKEYMYSASPRPVRSPAQMRSPRPPQRAKVRDAPARHPPAHARYPADFVQELYIKELKAYKAPVAVSVRLVSCGDAVSDVQRRPRTPTSAPSSRTPSPPHPRHPPFPPTSRASCLRTTPQSPSQPRLLLPPRRKPMPRLPVRTRSWPSSRRTSRSRRCTTREDSVGSIVVL